MINEMADNKKRWSVEVNKDNKRFSVCVEEVENGFITRITEEGGEEGNWEYETKTYISKSNPLSSSSALGNSVEKEDSNKIKGAVQSLKLLIG